MSGPRAPASPPRLAGCRSTRSSSASCSSCCSSRSSDCGDAPAAGASLDRGPRGRRPGPARSRPRRPLRCRSRARAAGSRSRSRRASGRSRSCARRAARRRSSRRGQCSYSPAPSGPPPKAETMADKVRTILDRNPLLLRMRTPNGTLVLTAIYNGAAASLRLLLERTPEDALGIHEAAATGNARRLKTILGQSRTRVNAANPEGFTPLGLAGFFGHLDAAKVLLENGADVKATSPSRFANTALDAAVAGNRTDVVKVLLAAHGNPNVRSEGNATPLHKAAQHGNLAIVEMLVAAGADVKAVRDGGIKPIDDAEKKGHADVVSFLRDRSTRA